jgi:tripartite-type tricarboxylate transporter receptor subunit TctC
VPPKLGVSSFAEFVAVAKSKPGEIVVGTNGAGTLPNLAGLALAKMGNIPVTIVPYNQGGTPAAIADIMGGRVHATIEAVFGLRGALQSGDLKLIGVMSPRPDPDFPEVPVIATTVPGFSAVGFMSLAAPDVTLFTRHPPTLPRDDKRTTNTCQRYGAMRSAHPDFSVSCRTFVPALRGTKGRAAQGLPI